MKNSLRAYLAELFGFAGRRVFYALFLMIFLGLVEGVGILMLIPLMQLAGLTDSGAATGGLSGFMANFFRHAGLPLNITSVLVVYIGIVSLFACLKRGQTVINAKIQQGFTRFLRNRLYSSLAYAEWPFIARNMSSDLVHVVTAEIGRVSSGTNFLLFFISTAFIVTVHIIIAFLLSAPMTALALACAAVLIFFMNPLNRFAFNLGKSQHENQGGMYNAIIEHLGGMKIAKSFGAEARHIRRFQEYSDQTEGKVLQFGRLRAKTGMYFDIGAVVAISILFYLAVGILHIAATRLFLLIYLLARIIPRVSLLHQYYQNIMNMLPAYMAVATLQNRSAAAAEPLQDGTHAPLTLEQGIVFQDVTFQYPERGEAFALQGVNLVIPSRQVTAIAGPSGAGKTTLADLIMGLLMPGQGCILIDDAPLTGERLHAWRRSIGYVPQETYLFHDTIRANLLWARPEATEGDLRLALEMAAIDTFVKSLPAGLDTVIGDRGMQLSGGERQRLALARALLRRPALLLLDEATSSLDRGNEQQIQAALERLRGDLTIVVIAHRLSTIRSADNIVVLREGRIVEMGKSEELAYLGTRLFHDVLPDND